MIVGSGSNTLIGGGSTVSFLMSQEDQSFANNVPISENFTSSRVVNVLLFSIFLAQRARNAARPR